MTSYPTPLRRSPVVGETLTLTIFSGRGKVEQFDVTVVEVFAAVARVKLFNGNILRASVSQLSV